LTYKKSL